MPLQSIRNFFKLESSSGILLCIAAVIALIFENSALHVIYDAILSTPLSIQVGALININKPLLLWINDGLMAIFFLLVGLEIKREVLEGQLSNARQISLPAVAALGGIVVPTLIYVYFNHSNDQYMKGWAIPAATDIAFALAILMLLGNKVHENLKICLLAIAIMDDLAAIVIIALFYTDSLSLYSVGVALISILGLFWLNVRGVTKLAPYIVIGIILWIAVLKSGVHATLAGVILAFFIPLKCEGDHQPLKHLEHELHPWVAYAILPIFAFANAGVSFKGLSLDTMMHPITLGVALGLFFGKQIGIMLFTAVGVLLRVCQLPDHVNWRSYYGMACITGVGFTMSLFIGTLAFSDYDNQTAVRLGVIIGSVASGLLGYFVLFLGSSKVNQ